MNNIPERLKTYVELAEFFAFHFGPMVRHSQEGAPSVASDEVETDAEKFASKLEKMGSTFIKFGQLLSTRSDLLAKPYVQALQRLQDDVQPVPYVEIQQIFEEDLGVSMKKAFAEIDAKPVAAASLGQTHLAVTREGQEVIVKVQRPGVRQRVIQDLDVLESVAAFACEHSESARRYGVSSIVEHFRLSILGELDYRNEASNLNAMARNLSQFPRLITP